MPTTIEIHPVGYANLKAQAQSKKLGLYYVTQATGYHAYAMAPNYGLRCMIETAGDIADFDANVKPTAVSAGSEAEVVGLSRVPFNDVSIKQQRSTPGHYKLVPLVIADIPVGQVRYNDYVVPDYTHGLDWLNAHFYAGEIDSGDQIATAKLIGPKIGGLAAQALTGATSVAVVSTPGVLVPTARGGALDEGFCLTFGTENSTAVAINSAPPSGSIVNPDQELREYEIKRIGLETPVGGGLVAVTIELFEALATDYAAGLDVNLIVRAMSEPIPLTSGDSINIGGDVFESGNMPPNSRVRFGFKNNGASPKTIRGMFTVLY